MDARFLRLTRTGDIQPQDTMLPDKLLQQLTAVLIPERTNVPAQMQTRLLVLLGKTNSAQRPACHFCRKRENNSAIRIPRIPLGPLQIGRRRSFLQLIAGGNRAFQTLPTFRTPTTVRKIKTNSHIQRRNVRACLPT